MYLIKVIGFKVVEDLEEIKQEIIKYNNEKIAQKSSKSKSDKNFDESSINTIDLRSSAIKLLVVRYYVSINGEDEYFTVLIKIPRIVDKYYFSIFIRLSRQGLYALFDFACHIVNWHNDTDFFHFYFQTDNYLCVTAL